MDSVGDPNTSGASSGAGGMQHFLQQVKADASSTFKTLTKTVIQKANHLQASATSAPATPIQPLTPASVPGKVFGRSLSKCIFVDTFGIPLLFHDITQYLTAECLDLVGIFRVPGSTSEIRWMKEQYNEGREVNFRDLDVCKTPHSVAALLKLYLRELPEPLLTFELYDCFMAAHSIVVEDAKKECIKKIIYMLPARELNVFAFLMYFLNALSQHADQNKMTSANLAMVFSPNLFQSSDAAVNMAAFETHHATRILDSIISDYDYYFDEFKYTEVPTAQPDLASSDDGSEEDGNRPSSASSHASSKPHKDPVKQIEKKFKKLNSKIKHTLKFNGALRTNKNHGLYEPMATFGESSSSHHSVNVPAKTIITQTVNEVSARTDSMPSATFSPNSTYSPMKMTAPFASDATFQTLTGQGQAIGDPSLQRRQHLRGPRENPFLNKTLPIVPAIPASSPPNDPRGYSLEPEEKRESHIDDTLAETHSVKSVTIEGLHNVPGEELAFSTDDEGEMSIK